MQVFVEWCGVLVWSEAERITLTGRRSKGGGQWHSMILRRIKRR